MKNWEKCCPCFASFAFSSSSPSSPDPSVRRRRAVPPPLLPSLHCHRRCCCCLIAYVDIFRRNHIKKNFLPAIGQSLQHAAASQSYYCNSRQFCIFILLVFVYTEGILVHQKYLVNNTLLLSVIYQTFKKDFSLKISENYYHRFFYIDPKISLQLYIFL